MIKSSNDELSTCTCTCMMMDPLSHAACIVHICPITVQSVLKTVGSISSHHILRQSVPCVDNSLTERVFSNVKPCPFFSDLQRVSSKPMRCVCQVEELFFFNLIFSRHNLEHLN